MTRQGGVGFALAALVVLTAGTATLGHNTPTPAGRSISPRAPACPLTPAKERIAVDAFKKLMPVLTHPRCFNCHGGVNPYVEYIEGGHLGGKMIGPNGRGSPPIPECQECHDGLPRWDTPGDIFFFAGKSPRELCIQFKRAEPSGAAFVRHIQNDPFSTTAFIGDRALNNASKDMSMDVTGIPFTNQPPPGDQQLLINQAQVWVDAVGAGWPVMPDCGCGRSGTPWVGKVTMSFLMQTPELGMLAEDATATVRFELDSSGGHWNSVSGLIRWNASATGGQCTGLTSGTVPIGLGSDQNPLAELRLENAPGGGQQFSVSIGPWPDQYLPLIKYNCKNAAPIVTALAPLVVMSWWGIPPAGGTVSPDGKTISGTYATALGAGSVKWIWDFHLLP